MSAHCVRKTLRRRFEKQMFLERSLLTEYPIQWRCLSDSQYQPSFVTSSCDVLAFRNNAADYCQRRSQCGCVGLPCSARIRFDCERCASLLPTRREAPLPDEHVRHDFREQGPFISVHSFSLPISVTDCDSRRCGAPASRSDK